MGETCFEENEQAPKAVFLRPFLALQPYLGHANFSTYSALLEQCRFIPAKVVKDADLRNKFKAPLGVVGRGVRFSSSEEFVP